MTGVQTCALPICFPVTIARSVDSDILDPATSIEVDLQRLVTRATGARVGDTQSTQLVVDVAAETKYGESSTSTDDMRYYGCGSAFAGRVVGEHS